MPPNRLPRHTSSAQLQAYAACPRKFRFRYVDGLEPETTSPALVVGGVFGGAVEWFFTEKIAKRRPTAAEAERIAAADFQAEVDHTEMRWGRWTPTDLKDTALRLVRFFLDRYHDLPVTAVEAPFEVALHDPATGEALRRPLIGRFDLVLEDDWVVELKTAASAYRDTNLARNLQFGAYSLALPAVGRRRLEVLTMIKQKTPRIEKHIVAPNAEQTRWFLGAATEIEGAILGGHYPPAPSAMNCSGCEYRRACGGDAEVEDEAA